MFGTVSQSINVALRKLSGSFKLTEANVSAVTKEIRRALLEADVDYSVARSIIDSTKQKALGVEVTKGVSPDQMFVKILSEELTHIMGGKNQGVTLKQDKPPSVVMVTGLQGAGKTTFTAKLAHFLRGTGYTPVLIACDIYRPAASEQLRLLAEQVRVPVYVEDSKDVLAIAQNGIKFAKENLRDVVIIDTAGRLHVDDVLMEELSLLKLSLSPSDILHVVDGTMGQEAVKTAKSFNERLSIGGFVVTKMDGDTRAGVVLSVKFVLGKPIKFISRSEKVDELDIFYPDRIAQRILGMGDVVSFVEQVESKLDKEKLEKLNQNFLAQTFTMHDFLEQIQQIKKLGSVKSVLDMLPGLNQVSSQIDENEFGKVESIIFSMTIEERTKPHIIDGSRRRRISRGCGRPIQDVNKLLKQFEAAKKMMKTVSKKKDAASQASLLKNIKLVKIRLRRIGRKKLPIYQIVTVDARKKRDGGFIEDIGRYEPKKLPHKVSIKEDRMMYWLGVGAEPTVTVRSLVRSTGLLYRRALEKQGKSESEIVEALSKWSKAETLRVSKKLQGKRLNSAKAKAKEATEKTKS
ncbi:hypothetical protein CHS0354_023960 [Potamilus streckersoni]|uniref:Signal recognition particle subunit SRP54 n=1 Tax=Potamilus streckersoni TaxID=2493646 RepID=A0AAE0RZE9_9BIVA|nr:hypothetical protein CHS0354_023960 [Potamilus streckersoni]